MTNTKRPDDINPTGTLRPHKGGTLRPPKGGTIRAVNAGGTLRSPNDADDSIEVMDEEITPFVNNDREKVEALDVRTLNRDNVSAEAGAIELNHITYSIDKRLSASTGEAEVFLLSKDGRSFALKLYYGRFTPELEVVKALKNASGTGVLVDILDYGTVTYRGEQRFFELMPFYSGGDLIPGSMRGNAEQLKVTALAMMMALKTAHDHKILHKDIKPNNFFYADESQTQLVLADFGIAQMFAYVNGKFEIVSNSQTRTPIYAAPELFSNTIENSSGKLEIRYFDEKSDYFSLGVALLTLWSGEKPLMMDEFALNRLKRWETGTLPLPNDMPEDIKRLILGLTTPNPVKRWAFDEFTRWLKGEKVAIDGENQRASASGLNIIYSGSKDWTVTSFEELAGYMLKDRSLAATYLYNGQISKWLNEAGYPELVAKIDELVRKTYPVNQQAAVTAAAYIFDGTLPYISPKGKELNTQEEIATDMVNNQADYLKEISDKDSNLFIFFRANGYGHLADRYVPLAKKEGITALWRIIFTLDRNQPFPILEPKTNTFRKVRTVKALLDYFATLPPFVYDNIHNQYVSLLWDEAFIMWLEQRDEALAGKIDSKLKALRTREHRTDQLYYYVLYLLDPSRPYELEDSDDYKNHTAEELARRINIDYLCYHVAGRHDGYNADYLKNVNQLMSCHDNRLYFYLKSKEVYQEKLDYIYWAFDFTVKEHKNCTGPYDKDIAFFKAVKALAGEALYAFVIDGQLKVIHNLDELKEIPAEYQKEDLRVGKLKAWLAVQYHEDPFADLSEPYAYEDLLFTYTCVLDDIDDENEVFERVTEAYNEVETGANECKKLLISNRIWRGVFGAVVAVPLLLVAVIAVIWGCAKFTNPSALWAYCIVAVPLTVALRILQILPKVDEWLLQPFGQKLNYTMLLHRWIVSAIYAFGICTFCWAMEHYGAGITGRITFATLAIVVLVWRYVLTIKDYPIYTKGFEDCTDPDQIALKIEPLYYAWKGHKDGVFDSETLDRQKAYSDDLKFVRSMCIKRTLWSLIPVALLFTLYLPFSPMCEKYIKSTNPDKWEYVYGERKKSATEETLATTRYYADVNKGLSVRKRASSSAGKLGSLGSHEEFDVVNIEGDWAKIVYGDGFGYVNKNYIKPVGNEVKSATSRQTNTKKAESAKNVETNLPAKAESTPASVDAPKFYTIKSNYNEIDVFSAKNTQTQFVIGSLMAGETFEVLSSDNTWTKINYKGRDAYVKTMQIQPFEN